MAVVHSFRMPKFKGSGDISIKNLPKTFLILNAVMASIYAIGVLSSMFAGALVPEYRITAVQLSAIVNGIATILFTLMVDPIAAHITDEAAQGIRPASDVRIMVFYLLAGRVAGTLVLSQLFFLPASHYIKGATLLVRGLFLY
jgi:hypothetical protein